jgi:predicted DsbA family dithiol-disulfide isomerase
MIMPKYLQVFSDYIWPWCYFSTGRIEKLKENFEIEVQWRAFPLHPETPEGGLTLEELFAGRDIDIPSAMARLKKVARELDLPWGERKKTYNSRLAQELGKWAETKGKGDEYHDAVFRAYFVDGIGESGGASRKWSRRSIANESLQGVRRFRLGACW